MCSYMNERLVCAYVVDFIDTSSTLSCCVVSTTYLWFCGYSMQSHGVKCLWWFIRVETSHVLYLTKTFVVETLYYCNLLCYLKCSTSQLTTSYYLATCNPFGHRSEKVDCPPKYNEIDGKVDRRSFNGKYEVVDGVPR